MKIFNNGENYLTNRENLFEVVKSKRNTKAAVTFRNADGKMKAKKALEIVAHISVYYPESADHYTSIAFIKAFVEGLSAQFPQLLIEEVEHAIHTGMFEYKYHTAPRLNDIFELVRKYEVERVESIEKIVHNQKQEFKKDLEVHKSIKDIISSAIDEGLKERAEMEKEVKRERLRRELERELELAKKQKEVMKK